MGNIPVEDRDGQGDTPTHRLTCQQPSVSLAHHTPGSGAHLISQPKSDEHLPSAANDHGPRVQQRPHPRSEGEKKLPLQPERSPTYHEAVTEMKAGGTVRGDRTVTSGEVLRAWDQRSSVRTKSRTIASELESGQSLFPRSLLPIVDHDMLTRQYPRTIDSLLDLRLFLYLDFTTALEQEVVNPALVDISKGLTDLEFSPALRLDAHRIYVDEGYHALAAVDLAQQLSDIVATPYIRACQHQFVGRLQKIASGIPKADSRLINIAAATVSETLISGTLSQIPQDQSVVQIVRQAVAEHANDERTHHAYFTRLHEVLWPHLSHRQQRLLAPLYADFILGFLAPDRRNLQIILQQIGMPEHAARRIVNETYEAIDLLPGIRHAARATIKLLQRTGVLEIGEAQDKFEDLGLVA